MQVKHSSSKAVKRGTRLLQIENMKWGRFVLFESFGNQSRKASCNCLPVSLPSVWDEFLVDQRFGEAWSRWEGRVLPQVADLHL